MDYRINKDQELVLDEKGSTLAKEATLDVRRAFVPDAAFQSGLIPTEYDCEKYEYFVGRAEEGSERWKTSEIRWVPALRGHNYTLLRRLKKKPITAYRDHRGMFCVEVPMPDEEDADFMEIKMSEEEWRQAFEAFETVSNRLKGE